MGFLDTVLSPINTIFSLPEKIIDTVINVPMQLVN